MHIETNAVDRKKLAKALAEFFGSEIRYMGPPTFAYEIAGCRINRAGDILSEQEDGEEDLRKFLIEKGFLEKPLIKLEVTVPLLDMSVDAMKRLVFMVHSKQYLLNKAAEVPSFAISEELITKLEQKPPKEKSEFLKLLQQNVSEGLAFEEETVTFTFASSENEVQNQAFIHLAPIMVRKAKESQRINPREQKPENEKYYFRSWLIQLGLGGKEAKLYRKTLMKNLKGCSAFRTEAELEQFKIVQKEKRDEKKAAQTQEQ